MMRGRSRACSDAIDPLTERTVDLVLVRVLVQVDFLVRMAAVEVRLHVAGDHHHRDRIERGVGDAGRRVGQPGSEMREQDARLAGRARVAVRRVRRDLLVPRADVADTAAAERVEHADDGVPGQAEHHLDAEPLEIVGEQVGREARLARRRQRFRNDVDGFAHGGVPWCVRRLPSRRTLRTAPARTGDPPESGGSPR